MKKNPLVILPVIMVILLAIVTFSSCTNVVKPEDIQAYLDKGNDLTITLPAGSSFDLVNVDGKLLKPGSELMEQGKTTEPTAPDTSGSGANGGKKFRNAGAFVKKAYATPGAYQCPTVCQIVIKSPER